MATVYTIGFSGKNKDIFIEILDAIGVKTLVDIRLWQVARFVPWASGTNLKKTLGTRYRYISKLAPTMELLTAYKDGNIDWLGYEKKFNNILAQRKIEKLFTIRDLDKICFLCSEKTADKCHRRLIAEYLTQHFPDITIIHL